MEQYLINDSVVFDSHLLTLSHEEDVTELSANEAELLLMLLNGVPTKAAVMKQVWENKGVFVTDSSYHQLIRALRCRLEERGISGKVIKTLPRLGLKFIGTASAMAIAGSPGHLTPCAHPVAPDETDEPAVTLIERPGERAMAADGAALARLAGAMASWGKKAPVVALLSTWSGILIWVTWPTAHAEGLRTACAAAIGG